MWKWTKKDNGGAFVAVADAPMRMSVAGASDATDMEAETTEAAPPGDLCPPPERPMIYPTGGGFVAKSIQDWMHEGEELYNAAFREFQNLEAQLAEMEGRLAAKQAEVNQIAGIIGKPPVEGNRRLTAQLVDERGPASVPNSSATIARALAGRQINR